MLPSGDHPLQPNPHHAGYRPGDGEPHHPDGVGDLPDRVLMANYQSGQAIVMIAIMLAVLVGMAARAIDGGLAYGLRRDVQAAVDAAALAAADSLQQNRSYSVAEQAATNNFGANARLYSAPACAPVYGAPGAAPLTVTCTYSDGTVLKQVVSALGAAGTQFTITASRSLALQFGRILTNGATPTIVTSATASVNNLLHAPAVAALSQSGCGGRAGSAISISGSGTLDIRGDLVSSGAIALSAGNLSVAGDIYARCQSTVPGSVTSNCYPSNAPAPCTFPDVAGVTRSGYAFTDPIYPPPVVAAGSRGAPGNEVVLSPGVYATDPVFNNNHGVGSDAGQQCWFLSGGVYLWQRGITNDGDFISNELKPPSEPRDTDNTRLARRQFWDTNGVNCAGSFRVSAVGGAPIPSGNWACEVTSARTDVYSGSNYPRESAPSFCQTVTVSPPTQAINVQISNVPGAQSYNVYAASPSSGCAGRFCFVGSIRVVGLVQNSATLGCPSFTGACSL